MVSIVTNVIIGVCILVTVMLYIIVCRCLSLHCQPVLPELWLHVYISIYTSLAHRVAVLCSVHVHVSLCLGEGLVSGADNSIELCSVCVWVRVLIVAGGTLNSLVFKSA